jgi:hypothetical protein
LQFYGEGLSEKNPDGALVLLTHATLPPADFFDKDDLYKIRLRALCSWREVYLWLRKIAGDGKLHGVVRTLASELHVFLENHGIRDMNKDDLAILSSFIARNLDSVVEATFETARSEIAKCSIIQKLGSPNWRPGRKAYERLPTGVLSDYIFPYKTHKEWGITWGLAPGNHVTFGNHSSPDNRDLFAFVYFETCKPEIDPFPFDKTRARESDLFTHWKREDDPKSEQIWIQSTSCSGFFGGDSGSTNGFVRWAKGRVEEAVKIMNIAQTLSEPPKDRPRNK